MWGRRSKLEKYLLITSVLLFLLCAILVCVSLKEVETETRILHVKQHPYLGELFDDNRNYAESLNHKLMTTSPVLEIPCLEKHCVFAASEILKSIDDRVDP